MLSGKVWPAHPKPLPDELLSSWIVRVAEANAIKLQTLSWMLFGNGLSPWNRDIDRNAPRWLIDALSPFRVPVARLEAARASIMASRGALSDRR